MGQGCPAGHGSPVLLTDRLWRLIRLLLHLASPRPIEGGARAVLHRALAKIRRAHSGPWPSCWFRVSRKGLFRPRLDGNAGSTSVGGRFEVADPYRLRLST